MQMKNRKTEDLVTLGTRVPQKLKDRLDKHVKNSQDSTLQDAIIEAIEDYLGKASVLGPIGLLSPRDRAMVEEFAAALLRRDDMAAVALRLMEVEYAEWRTKADQGPTITEDRARD